MDPEAPIPLRSNHLQVHPRHCVQNYGLPLVECLCLLRRGFGIKTAGKHYKPVPSVPDLLEAFDSPRKFFCGDILGK